MRKPFTHIVPMILALMLSANAAPAEESIILDIDLVIKALYGKQFQSQPLPVRYRIFDSATEGPLLWAEEQKAVLFDNAISLFVGKGVTVSGAFDKKFFTDDGYWFELEIDGDILSPRHPLTTTDTGHPCSGKFYDATVKWVLMEEASVSTVEVTETGEAGRSLDTHFNAITLGGVTRNSWPEGPDNLGNHQAQQDLDMAGKRISRLAAPVDADDAATRQYVDSRAGKPSAAPTISKNITMKGHWISGDGDSEGIYVADSGNVGIGTAFPDSRLSVRGDISITDDTASILRIGRYGPDYPFSYVTAGDTATQIRFQIAQVTKMTINSDGNVGIGTTEPNAPLEVKGNIISDPPSEGTHVATKAYVDTRTASGPVTMITAREAASDLKGAVAYCRALTGTCEHFIDGTCDKTEYSDWRLPTAEEIVLFVGIADDAGKLWSRTPFQSNPGHTILMDLKSGGWIAGEVTGAESAGVRCVR